MQSSWKLIAKNIIAHIILITGLFTAACTDQNPENKNSNSSSANANLNSNQVKDDVAELLLVVRLPEVPTEAVWREETSGNTDSQNPNAAEKKLIAVLKYDDATAAKLIAQLEKHKKAEAAEIGAENWFPEELVAQSQISGNEMLKGITYGANDFYNMPYGSGKITRVENTNYFVLELIAL